MLFVDLKWVNYFQCFVHGTTNEYFRVTIFFHIVDPVPAKLHIFAMD